jgi:hypothetical protein
MGTTVQEVFGVSNVEIGTSADTWPDPKIWAFRSAERLDQPGGAATCFWGFFNSFNSTIQMGWACACSLEFYSALFRRSLDLA